MVRLMQKERIGGLNRPGNRYYIFKKPGLFWFLVIVAVLGGKNKPFWWFKKQKAGPLVILAWRFRTRAGADELNITAHAVPVASACQNQNQRGPGGWWLHTPGSRPLLSP